MDASKAELDQKLCTRTPEAEAEVIELAGSDLLDVVRSKAREQEVLDRLDEPTTR